VSKTAEVFALRVGEHVSGARGNGDILYFGLARFLTGSGRNEIEDVPVSQTIAS
jgi:hypothetical protein